MQVAFHLGAPCTDDDMLLTSLGKNRTVLAPHGIAIPEAAQFRTVLRDTMRALKGKSASPEITEALLDAIWGEDSPQRLVLSDPRLVSINRLVAQGAQFWPAIARQTDNMRALFPEAQIEFFIALRDPGTLLPALFRASRYTDFAEFGGDVQPEALRWSEMLIRLREAQPDAQITVWANEDTPLIWGDIMRALAGLAPNTRLKGESDLVQTLLDPSVAGQLDLYLMTNPPQSDAHLRRIHLAFLERYAKADLMVEDCTIPDWDQDLLDRISANYEEDLQAISAMDGVRLIAP
ncbi:hypothetical protein OE810_10565 [Rhodobacteraceae bacterium XHP0102]|nr:hypothetical protein [Rhodobacteraceae bacterium XHP0102]